MWITDFTKQSFIV